MSDGTRPGATGTDETRLPVDARDEVVDAAERQAPAYDTEPAAEASRPEKGPDPGVVLSIEDLVGAKVVTAAGATRGTVVDVIATRPPDLRIQSLVVGASGWLFRLRVWARLPRPVKQSQALDEIAWDAVDRWDGLRVVLREGAEAEGVRD